MAKRKLNLPKIAPFIAIVAVVGFVAVVSLLKIFVSPKDRVYARVKVSQGFWWATTSRPELWYAKAVKKGEVEKDILGNEVAKILKVRYYPYYTEGKYDIYLTLELQGSYNEDTKEVSFKRSPLSIGSPIELSFPTTQITGTVIELSQEPIEGEYVEKTVYFTKRFAYPWEYDAIRAGDTYSDGEEVVFEVLGKSQRYTSILSPDLFGTLNSQTAEERRYITVKAKMKARQKAGQLVYGEDTVLAAGAPVSIVTDNFVFEGYIISRVE
jgi:hypothetical protein